MNIVETELSGPDGRPIPLSAAIETDGFIFLSGQIAPPLVTGIREQTARIFDQIEDVLKKAGVSLDHVIKCTVWLTKPEDFTDFNAIYRERLGAPYPARSCVISQLVLVNACVEIEVIASRGHRRR